MRKMSDDVLKCPYCGSTDVIYREENEEYICMNCGAVIPVTMYAAPSRFNPDRKHMGPSRTSRSTVLIRRRHSLREIDLSAVLKGEVLTHVDKMVATKLTQAEHEEIERLVELAVEKALTYGVVSKNYKACFGYLVAKAILNKLLIPYEDLNYNCGVSFIVKAALKVIAEHPRPKVSPSLLRYLSDNDHDKYTLLSAFSECVTMLAWMEKMRMNAVKKVLSRTSPFQSLFKMWKGVTNMSYPFKKFVRCVLSRKEYNYYFPLTYLHAPSGGSPKRKIRLPKPLALSRRVYADVRLYRLMLGLHHVQPGLKPTLKVLKEVGSVDRLQDMVTIDGKPMTEHQAVGTSVVDVGAIALLLPRPRDYKEITELPPKLEKLYAVANAVSVYMLSRFIENTPVNPLSMPEVELSDELRRYADSMVKDASNYGVNVFMGIIERRILRGS